MNRRTIIHLGLLFLALACNLPALAPVPDTNLMATLRASTPQTGSPAVSIPTDHAASAEPTGKIAMTCQIFKEVSKEQICIVNADGSDYRRLTSGDSVRHYYPSIAPDGQSLVYSAYNEPTKRFEIFELNFNTNESTMLTHAFGDLNAPEISPDGKTIAFTRFYISPDKPTIWLMNRDGTDLRQVSDFGAWDSTWSPDGSQILFAGYINNSNQLFVVNLDGTGLHQVGNFPLLRGRSDWSIQDLIVTYSGRPWERELYLLNSDGSDQRQISPPGGNSQGPSFSPDGEWVAFTSYFDRYEVQGCEIYIVRVDGSDLRRLTNNDYCDYQPRWGP